MLNQNLNQIVKRTSILFFGVLLFTTHSKSEETQIKPNIHVLTKENQSVNLQKLNTPEKNIEENTPNRIPGKIHKHSLGVGLGQTFLRSDLSANGNDKITADLYYNYSASYTFDFLANVHYSRHEYLNRSATLRGLALAIKGKGYQLDAFSPYVFGGFGFYLPTVKRLENNLIENTKSQMVFGINAGAGVELRLNNETLIGLVAHYHDPFDVRQDVSPSLESSYFKLLMTASYTFN